MRTDASQASQIKDALKGSEVIQDLCLKDKCLFIQVPEGK